MPKKSRRRRILSHISKIAISIVTVSLMTSPAMAAADGSQVISSGAKKVSTLKKLGAIPHRAGLTYLTFSQVSLVVENAGHPMAPFGWFIIGIQLPSIISRW